MNYTDYEVIYGEGPGPHWKMIVRISDLPATIESIQECVLKSPEWNGMRLSYNFIEGFCKILAQKVFELNQKGGINSVPEMVTYLKNYTVFSEALKDKNVKLVNFGFEFMPSFAQFKAYEREENYN